MESEISEYNPEEEIKALSDLIQKQEDDIEYKIVNNDKLLHKETNEKFKFTNQAEYEKISTYVINYVKYLMIATLRLRRLWVPIRKVTRNFEQFLIHSKVVPQADIYVSEDFLTNTDRLLVLIQGTGCVRAGVWARSVCINESLELGSVIPFVEDGYKNNMSVIVFNPNERRDPITNNIISEFSTMEDHCLWVWDNVIKKFNQAKEIYVVAHSMGGYCTVDLVKVFKDDFNSGIIRKIAFTDSVHGKRVHNLNKETYANLITRSINFVTSEEKAGTFLKSYDKAYDGVHNFSAGHNKHEYTSGCAREEIWKFFFDDSTYYINSRLYK